MDSKWKSIFERKDFLEFFKKVEKEYESNIVYPSKEDIFNAFNHTPYDSVKVVIIGQDPYHGNREAMGLSFSVKEDIKMPPSLRNIFKELKNDLGEERLNTDLTDWAKDGVLLLNCVLTVEKDKASSHKNLGWEKYTDEIIKIVNEKNTPVVFILWGNFAKKKKVLITNKKHLVLESVHPSPLSANRGFFGTKPFSKTNEFLEKNNVKGINW